MLLESQEDVLAHALQDLILHETEIEHMAMSVVDSVQNDALRSSLDACAGSSPFRVAQLRQLLNQVGGTIQYDETRTLQPQQYTAQAVDAASSGAAIDLVALVNIRRALSAAQRLYADTAVHAMRWELGDVGRELGAAINDLSRILGRLEDLDGDIAPLVQPRRPKSDPTQRTEAFD